MLEFTLAGQNYRAGKLNAFQQLHVSRKLAPILPKLLPAALKVSADPGNMSLVAEAFAPAAQAMADMSEEDCNFVVHTCLGVVSMQQGNAWAPVWNANTQSLMFDSIDMMIMLQITFHVIQDSLGSFIQGLLANLPNTSSPAPAA
jgi:hypothetical protein